MTVPPQTPPVLEALREQGVVPVIAHPERYTNLDANLRLPGQWRAAGAHLQVNGGSLLGRYGKRSQHQALVLLQRGWADYLSSDFHARGDPLVRSYEAMLQEGGAEVQAELLLRTNPARLLEGQAPEPVPPVKLRASLLERLRRILP